MNEAQLTLMRLGSQASSCQGCKHLNVKDYVLKHELYTEDEFNALLAAANPG